MTTRIPGVALGLALLSGCATTGPNYIYATAETDPAVHSLGPEPRDIPAAVAPGERVLGLAYDYNTDHLFLRIAPAQVIRVIERPSGKILREMPLPDNSPADEVVGTNTGPAAAGNGAAAIISADLAIRSGDRHLFAVHRDGRSVMELTLFGEVVRRIELPGLNEPIGGLAFDQRQSQLLALTGSTVAAFAPDGRELGRVTLNAAIQPVSLGYDSDARHYFVPLAGRHSVGEFDAHGNLIATHPVAGNNPITALDAGPRSLVRVF